VVQYVGEVITSEEAEVRGKKYDAGRLDKNFKHEFHSKLTEA
jgi:hypothetical protein